MTILGSPPPTGQDMVAGLEFRRFMRRWATGVAVVTTSVAGWPAGCTVNSFTSVSLAPPLLLVSMSNASRTLSAVIRQGMFGVNLLGCRQRQLAELFATTAADHFRDVPFRMRYGVPVLDGTIAAAVCALESYLPVADHVLLLGTPHWCTQQSHTEPDCAGQDGDDRSGQPMVFFAGQYLTTTADADPGTDRHPPVARLPLDGI
jgi:flavin reductase (DIM6/NTAB) family NADH-FMN oxidoreductase RutF